ATRSPPSRSRCSASAKSTTSSPGGRPDAQVSWRAQMRRFAWRGVSMPPRLRRVTLADGTPFWCLRPREIRVIEDSVRDYFRHGITVDDGDIVFDVGANIGLFAHAVRRL